MALLVQKYLGDVFICQNSFLAILTLKKERGDKAFVASLSSSKERINHGTYLDGNSKHNLTNDGK